MNVIRLNTSHQGVENALAGIRNVLSVSGHIAIMVDTKDPEMRTTPARADLPVHSGDMACVVRDKDGECKPGSICLTYDNFAEELSVGDKILIDDGDIEFEVKEKNLSA